MYDAAFTAEAEHDLERLAPEVRRRVLARLAWLVEHCEAARHEPLAGALRDLYKLRVGDYRILYDIVKEDRVILVHAVGHRREVYR